MSADPRTTERIKRQKRLPPYGRELLELRRKGLVPDRWVVISLDSWQWGRGFQRVVLPADLDPQETDFSGLAALDVALVWSSRITAIKRRDETIRALVSVLPSFLWAIDVDEPEAAVFVISRARGLELPEYLT